ncbi:MAG: Asp-tRNA(Asn)/Glu-tRNA(Gln) amidotransferase subunit GatB [Chloroflexota bacterium]
MSATAAAPDRLAGILERWEPVIGIEVHSQLRTASKMFCGCSTAYDGAAPNTHTCPVCLGLPGALPVINRRAVELVLATGAAIDARTPEHTRWDRKNYFYPDLPKGYQISQYDLPLAAAGTLTIDTSDGPFTIRITRAHLEEDTAKLVHAPGPGGERISLVDFNRSGVPLMEIVTEPDVRTAEQARRYAEELQLLLRTIGASDADMERGQLRVEANVSLRRPGTAAYGTRVEVKNMNSFRSVERAINFEIERQAAALDAGEPLVQETRGWSDERGETYRMRVKETSDDYRYFPEPDLPPLRVDAAWLAEIRSSLPELPAARRTRYRQLGLSPVVASTIAGSHDLIAGFDRPLDVDATLPIVELGRLVTQEYAAASNTRLERGPTGLVGRATPTGIADIVRASGTGTLTRANAKEVLNEHIETGAEPRSIVESRGYHRISDAVALGEIVDGVIAANPAAVADVRAGKAQAIGFLVGAVMKQTRGQANAAVVQAALRQRLGAGEGG